MKSANNTNGVVTDYYQYVEDMLAPEDVHTTSLAEDVGNTGVFIILAVVLSIVHAFNLYLFLGTDMPAIVPVLIHLAVAGVTCVLTYAQYKGGRDVRHLAILAIVSATTGLFGTVGALLGLISTAIFRTRSQEFSSWYESIFPTDAVTDPQTIYDSIMEGVDENPRTYGVMPFMDVMKLGSDNQKRRALAKMTSRFSPKFAPAFRVALADTSNTVRVQAATAIAKIEREFATKLERIELARSQAPNNVILTLALAKFYDDYAFTGILDPELERLNRERAISTYKAYLQQDPNSTEARVAIGRLLFRSRRWQEAADWFHQADRKSVV